MVSLTRFVGSDSLFLFVFMYKIKVILDSDTMALKIPLACTRYNKIIEPVIGSNSMGNFGMPLLPVALPK